MRYLSSRDPDQPHPLEAEVPSVDTTDESVEVEETFEVGFVSTDRTYMMIPSVEEGLEVDPSTLNPKEVPRHDMRATENSGAPAPDVVLPGGVSNAHPDWRVGDAVNTVPDIPVPEGAEAEAAGTGVTGTGEAAPERGEGEPRQQDEEGIVYSPALVRDFQRADGDTEPAEAEIVSTVSGEQIAPEPAAEPTAEGEPVAAAEPADGEPAPSEPADSVLKPPSGNGSAAEWRAYAVSQGMDPAEADNLGRDELKERFGG